jgi:hypothetical protein
VIPDDTPEISESTVPVIDAPSGQRGGFCVIIRELPTVTSVLADCCEVAAHGRGAVRQILGDLDGRELRQS